MPRLTRRGLITLAGFWPPHPGEAVVALGLAILLTVHPQEASAQLLPPLQPSCVCTPLVMNSNSAGTQTWFVRALGGPLDITAFARSVNPFDPATATIQVFNSSGGFVAGSAVSYPPGQPPGTEVPAVVPTITAAGGHRPLHLGQDRRNGSRHLRGLGVGW